MTTTTTTPKKKTTVKKTTTTTTAPATSSDAASFQASLDKILAGAGGDTTQANLYGLPSALASTPVPEFGRNMTTALRGIGRLPKQATILQHVTDLYQMSKPELRKLQEQLYSGHFYADAYYSKNGKTKLQSEYADDDTRAALVNALIDAARSGRTLDQTIAESAAAFAAAGGPGSGTDIAPFSPQVSSPEEIRAALNQQLPTILGHGVSDVELDSLTTLYQSLQMGAQRQTYDTAQSGGTATNVIPIDVFAQQQAEKLHPNEAQANKFGALASQFRKSLSDRSVETATF